MCEKSTFAAIVYEDGAVEFPCGCVVIIVDSVVESYERTCRAMDRKLAGSQKIYGNTDVGAWEHMQLKVSKGRIDDYVNDLCDGRPQ
jgi:hypothetical protein